MSRPRRGFGSTPAGLVVLALVSGCVMGTSSPTSPPCPAEAPSPAAGAPASEGDLLILGRIITMDQPGEADALLIEDGLVTCVGALDEVMALAGEEVPVVDIGSNVAYPGFVDAHAHWIAGRQGYGADSAQDAMDAALSRGWTSISEQLVIPEQLDELTALAEEDLLPIRLDAYLGVSPGDEFLHDTDREPGSVGDHLRVKGLKTAVAEGSGGVMNWEPDDLASTMRRADEAGWQLSIHAVSTEDLEVALDAYEAVLGTSGPNPLHHRIEHATEVSDDQLDRLAAMDLVTVIHPAGGVVDNDFVRLDADYPPEQFGWLTRLRDFVDAGLHVAAGTDAPWILRDLALADDSGRPVDQIAGGMDGRGRVHPESPDWIDDQLLTAEQALRAVTLDAAYALGDGERRGHLAPGTLGDVTILSGDVTGATPGEIRSMDVIATIVGGEAAYCSDDEVCGAH